MDIKAFQDSRQAELDAFLANYATLKTKYSAALSAAIGERDSGQQVILVQKVLDANTQLTAAVRTILGSLSSSTSDIDTATLNQLTADLVKYQQDFLTLQQSTDKLQTLKMIQNTTQSDLQRALTLYNVYILALCILCVIVIILAIRAAWTGGIFGGIVRRIKNTVRPQ
jgi:hypothetical protein|uniref:Uncharacterized protein n=1 Tax=viral metagenome TaxID=1070528 RepID=A0A6C0AI99_9ZZZZ